MRERDALHDGIAIAIDFRLMHKPYTPPRDDITQLLQSVEEGRDGSHEELFQRVYRELKAMAGAQMVRERQGHTLQPTALVSEAYLRLTPGDGSWQNRAHFFGSAARAMRRILVDHARRHQASKRGSDAHKVTFDDLAVAAEEPDLDLLALDEALDALTQQEPRLAEVVQLRYFAGLGVGETAEMLGISPATVKRDWTYARAWLLERMSR